MKKTIMIIAAVLFLTGCGNNEKEQANQLTVSKIRSSSEISEFPPHLLFVDSRANLSRAFVKKILS
jgi:protein involved in sex pheromone biosynthesis